MTLNPRITKYRPWIAASGAVLLMAAVLLIQHSRHGWPFSLHHGALTEAHERATSQSPAAAERRGDARVPVEVSRQESERLDIQLEPVRLDEISGSSRYTAVVATDESRISHVHTRVSGWIEALHINTTGQVVRAGQPLAEVFSQELFASQTEYLSARKQAKALGGSAIVEAAHTRLTVLGMTAAEIEALERAGSARRTVTVLAPRGGIVLRRGVTVGTAVDPSTDLLTIADLSRVWIFAEIPESESSQLVAGSRAMLAFPSSGRPPFAAKVDFIYPTLSERTRTLRIRFAVENPDARLRPGLYGTASFDTSPRKALTVSRDAVVDTGNTQHVFVQTSNGTLEPRTVRLGARVADRIEILDGLTTGELVVTSGVFLIDSESRLRASGTGGHFGHGKPSDGGSTPPPPSESDSGHSAHGD